MNLLFVGKSLSCIAVTGTIGAVAVLPKVRSTLSSLEREIDSDSLKLSPLVNVTERPKDTKKEDIKTLITRVTTWLSTNGNCKISLASTDKREEYYEVSEDKKEEADINHPLFISQIGMGGKSKFERLADDLEEKARTDKAIKEKYSKYLEDFKKRCQGKANQTLKLQWRSQIPKDKTTKENFNIENLEGLMNLWVYEKEDATTRSE